MDELEHMMKESEHNPPDARRILIADDETSVRLIIRLILSRQGYQDIVEAHDGQEAMEKYVDASPPFDLVLLDLDMPRLNGWEVLEQIRKLNGKTKVILLSGGTHTVDGDGVAFMHKPFENDELVAMVKQMLGGPSSSAG